MPVFSYTLCYCPHCGAKPDISVGAEGKALAYNISCNSAMCTVKPGSSANSAWDAVRAWNKHAFAHNYIVGLKTFKVTL